MKTHFSPKNNPRVIIIQKLYGKFFNDEENLSFPKHRFKKFIKDVVLGSIERNELIMDEIETKLDDKFSFRNFSRSALDIISSHSIPDFSS